MTLHPPSDTFQPEQMRPDDDEIDIAAVLGTLWRGKWLIAFCTVLAIFIGGYYAYVSATPLYRSTATVILESREEQVVDLQSVIGGLSGDTSVVNSEVEVLRSRSLMEKVVNRLDLIRDPEFNRSLRPPEMLDTLKANVKGWVKSALNIDTPQAETLTEQEAARATLDATVSSLIESITVSNIRQSLVFRITVETECARKSALIADTILQHYILNQLEVKFDATEQATNWLTERVSSLQAELEGSEARLSNFSSVADLVDVASLQALERQLKELRDRIAGAEGAAEAATARALVLTTAETRETRTQAAADRQLSQFFQRLSGGENETIAQAFDTRFEQILTRAELDAGRAESQLRALSASRDEMQARIAGQSEDLITLQQLTREAEASRVLYEYFLGRLKETSAQQGIQQA
ncbi:MAG: GumC family protein, partial [Halocynthiibacter sp.]